MADQRADSNPVSIKVFEEKATVDKQVVEKGAVRISKKVHQNDEPVNVSVRSEEVTVERVSMNKYVDVAPEVRYEGNTTIVSVIKEVAIVETKLMLVEEVRITKKVHTKDEMHNIPLRREEIIIDSSRDSD